MDVEALRLNNMLIQTHTYTLHIIVFFNFKFEMSLKF